MKKVTLIVMCLTFAGCASLPFQAAPEQPKVISQWHQSETTNPVIVGQVDGKSVVANQVTRNYDVGLEKTEPKPSIVHQIIAWFVGLGVLGGALAFFFPTVFFAIILWAMHKYQTLKQAYLDHKSALEETVKAIKSTKLVDSHQPLHDALDNAQSQKTKEIVAQIATTS